MDEAINDENDESGSEGPTFNNIKKSYIFWNWLKNMTDMRIPFALFLKLILLIIIKDKREKYNHFDSLKIKGKKIYSL